MRNLFLHLTVKADWAVPLKVEHQWLNAFVFEGQTYELTRGAFKRRKKKRKTRLLRWALELQSYDIDFRYAAGKSALMGVPDCLSQMGRDVRELVDGHLHTKLLYYMHYASE